MQGRTDDAVAVNSINLWRGRTPVTDGNGAFGVYVAAVTMTR